MKPLSLLATSLRATPLLLGTAASCHAADAAAAAGHPFDGQWSVVLVCDDTHDRTGLVKGYEFTFVVTIADGKLQGQYGAKGRPSSVVYTGEVADDGTLEVRAAGNTGHADRTVGKLARGSEYGYTMAGKLDGSRGQAVRRELRPCTATFGRL